MTWVKRGVWYIACALAVCPVGASVAADDSAEAWNERIGQLAAPADDEIVWTAVGDAIWTHKISDSEDVRLQSLFNVMRASDVAFVNFEQVMADSGFPTNKAIAKADPSIVDEFVWAGADMVSLANNHMMDFGPSGLATTLATLDKNGIKHAGAGTDLSQAFKYTVIEKKGLKIALVAVMVSPNLTIGTGATATSPGVAFVRGSLVRPLKGEPVLAPWEEDLHAMEEAIKEAKKAADLVAISMHIHWGELDEIDPSGKQLVARAAIDAGADIVLGHGPHVVNGIEFYKGKPILYSIGNFAFQFPPGAYEYFPDIKKTVQRLSADGHLFESMMVRMVLSSRGEIRRMEILPLGLTRSGDPHFVSDERADAIFERMKALSGPLGTGIKRESWYAVVEPPKTRSRR